jgi:adenine/guanine phosphoribosyltransferase-like PRPP-binding protein
MDIKERITDDPLETLKNFGGFYNCPKDKTGKRLGPLVGYAGKYTAPDGTQKQWVGDIYANFAKAEEYPYILYHFAEQMWKPLILLHDNIDVFCGAPIGGYSFATMLGYRLDNVFKRRVIKAEKKVTALATENIREQSTIIFARHEVKKGDNVAIVEDVCNNFSTTDKIIDLIEQAGGRVVAIVCLLNRSLTVESEYQRTNRNAAIPVISLVRLVIPEYKQDDFRVNDDILQGNVILKPKDEWTRLMKAMNRS